jgi:hypothetical protein
MIMFRVDASNNEDHVTVLLDGLEESTEVEIADDLWPLPIGGVQVVPNVLDPSDGEPMALRVADEPHLMAQVLLDVLLGVDGFGRESLLLQNFSQHLYREIAIQSHVI